MHHWYYIKVQMHSPWLPVRKLNICREWAVHWYTDIVALSIGPRREATTSQQYSEIHKNS